MKLFKVDAVHPIAKRVIESNLTEEKKNELVDELLKAGYENQNINVDLIKQVFEEGDEIIITKEDFDKLPEEDDVHEQILPSTVWRERLKKNNAKKSIRHIFGKEPAFPLKGKLESLRINRTYGHLIVKWENQDSDNFFFPSVDEQWNGTNTSFLEDMGYEFDQPKFEVLPILECSDQQLSTHETIVKHMMVDNNWDERLCESYLKPVIEAMSKAEAVFYQP